MTALEPINQQEPMPRATAGNENTGFIKLLAILCMIADHVAVAFFPKVVELRLVGRMAFPLFAWCLCVGAEYTRSPKKYALRLLAVGVVSQPIYLYAMNHAWSDLNIFFELFLGLMAIMCIRFDRWGSRYWGPALILLDSCLPYFNYSYDWKGIAFILILYVCRKNRAALAASVISFCLFWGQGSATIITLFGVTLPLKVPVFTELRGVLSAVYRVQFFAVLALPLILVKNKKRLRLPKWVAYAAYPAHLAVIMLIRHWQKITAFFSQWL